MSTTDIFFPYVFEAPIEYLDFGRMAYTVVYLPSALRDELPLDQYPRLRISAEVADLPVDGALQPAGGERWYLMVTRQLMKQGNLAVGDEVEVRLQIADQDHVDVPTELQLALDEDGDANTAWNQLTAGRQRGLVHRIVSAKRTETRAKRLAEVLATLKE